MYASEMTMRIIEELEFLAAERSQAKERGPHFRIVHRYPQQNSPCGAHEEVSAICLVHAGRQYQVRLGTTLSVAFDFLARHNQLAQTAKQIERGTRPGRRGHRPSLGNLNAGIPRRYVRIYVERIRAAIAMALREAGLDIEPNAVLVSEDTAMNETAYRLRATFEWVHTAE
jgi:hypothetical protein